MCLLPCGFEQPAGGFAFYLKLLLNVNNCRANKAAPKDNMHLLKFILMELGEIAKMDSLFTGIDFFVVVVEMFSEVTIFEKLSFGKNVLIFLK